MAPDGHSVASVAQNFPGQGEGVHHRHPIPGGQGSSSLEERSGVLDSGEA